MPNQENSNLVPILATICREEKKCRLEKEEVLPDYCGDLLKIIRTDVKPKIESKNVYEKEGAIYCDIQGKATFSVIYITNPGETGNANFQIDFSHTFKTVPDKKINFDTSLIHSELSVLSENIGARIVSPRKILLRGDINVSLMQRANRLAEIQKPEVSELLEKQTKEVKAACLTASGEKSFFLKEDFLLPKEFEEIGKIVDCDTSIVCDSIRCLDGKIIFNATAEINCLYRGATSSKLINIVQPIEHSEILEMEGVTPECTASVSLLTTSLRAASEYNEEGENRIITFEYEYSAAAFAVKNNSFSVITDAFSPTHKLEAVTRERDFDELVCSLSESFKDKAKIPLKSSEAVRVESAKGYADIRDTYIENGNVMVALKLYFKLLAIRADESPEYIEDTADFTLALATNGNTEGYDFLKIEIDGGLKEINASISEGAIDLEATFNIFARIMGGDKTEYLEKAEIGAKKESTLLNAPIILYYPGEGETLWKIAKHYSISPASLMKANNLESEDISDLRLLRIENYNI